MSEQTQERSLIIPFAGDEKIELPPGTIITEAVADAVNTVSFMVVQMKNLLREGSHPSQVINYKQYLGSAITNVEAILKGNILSPEFQTALKIQDRL